MDKKFKIVLIAIWSFIAIILTAFLIFGLSSGKGSWGVFSFSGWSEENAQVQKQESLSVDSCSTINVDSASADILVKVTDDTELKIVQRGNGKFKDSEKFTASQDGDTISIRQGSSHIGFFFLGFGTEGNIIELDIPKAYAKALNIQTASGDIAFDSDISLSDLKCSMSSGDFNSRGNISADGFSIDSSSGDINSGSVKCGTYNITSTSGDIDINSITGSGKVYATSGDIKITYSGIDDYSEVGASSGDIVLKVSKDISFEFNGQCTSGDINSDFDIYYKNKNESEATAKVGSGPYKRLDVHTTSGDISISQ